MAAKRTQSDVRKSSGTAITGVCAAAVLAVLCLDAENIFTAARGGITACLEIIIPSLFAPMVFAAFVLDSGAYKVMCKPFFAVVGFFAGLCRLPRLSEEEFSVFLMSMLGGYPVGAKLVGERRLSPRLLAFCYCGSPSFLMSVAGFKLYGSVLPGFVVYASNVIACCVCATLFMPRGHGASEVAASASALPAHLPAAPRKSTAEALFDAITSAKSLGVVCLCVCAFAVLIEILSYTCGIFGVSLNVWVKAVFEISNSAALRFPPLPLVCAVMSFGGICVAAQVALLSKVSMRWFWAARLPAAVISAAVCLGLMKVFDVNAVGGGIAQAFAVVRDAEVTRSGSAVASACAVVMVFIFVLMRKRRRWKK